MKEKDDKYYLANIFLKGNTVRPHGTRPLGTRTSQIHGFCMGPKKFQIHGFPNVGHSFNPQLHGYELGPIIKPRCMVYFLPS